MSDEIELLVQLARESESDSVRLRAALALRSTMLQTMELSGLIVQRTDHATTGDGSVEYSRTQMGKILETNPIPFRVPETTGASLTNEELKDFEEEEDESEDNEAGEHQAPTY